MWHCHCFFLSVISYSTYSHKISKDKCCYPGPASAMWVSACARAEKVPHAEVRQVRQTPWPPWLQSWLHGLHGHNGHRWSTGQLVTTCDDDARINIRYIYIYNYIYIMYVCWINYIIPSQIITQSNKCNTFRTSLCILLQMLCKCFAWVAGWSIVARRRRIASQRSYLSALTFQNHAEHSVRQLMWDLVDAADTSLASGLRRGQAYIIHPVKQVTHQVRSLFTLFEGQSCGSSATCWTVYWAS